MKNIYANARMNKEFNSKIIFIREKLWALLNMGSKQL
jgi:hypothetical protein